MGYREAIEAAGAKVLAYEEFGSYQGDWLAKIKVGGEVKFVRDYYGSCSVCDAFQADFGFQPHKCGKDEYYDPFYDDDGFREGCGKCQELKKQLAEFGKEYVDSAMSFDECMKVVSENLEWDMDAKEMVDWLTANR